MTALGGSKQVGRHECIEHSYQPNHMQFTENYTMANARIIQSFEPDTITFYQVVHDITQWNGSIWLGASISRKIKKLSTLRRVLKRIKREVPNARGKKITAFL